MQPESSLPYSQAPATCLMLRDASSRNTPPTPSPPSGDPSGGVFYLRIVLSPEEASRLWVFRNILFFTGRSC